VVINAKRIHRAGIPKYKSELKLREGKGKMEKIGNVSVNNPPYNTKTGQEPGLRTGVNTG
jgi:hypothetical protein